MILVINTHAGDRVMVALVSPQGEIIRKKDRATPQRQATTLLPSIDTLLKQNKQTLNDVRGIAVVQGPGGFTAVRIGVATANALSYALQIPAVGISTKEYTESSELAAIAARKLARRKQPQVITPLYDRPPNITKPKRRAALGRT